MGTGSPAPPPSLAIPRTSGVKCGPAVCFVVPSRSATPIDVSASHRAAITIMQPGWSLDEPIRCDASGGWHECKRVGPGESYALTCEHHHWRCRKAFPLSSSGSRTSPDDRISRSAALSWIRDYPAHEPSTRLVGDVCVPACAFPLPTSRQHLDSGIRASSRAGSPRVTRTSTPKSGTARFSPVCPFPGRTR